MYECMINSQSEILECASRPCRFGATCIDQLGAYMCICVPGYIGVNCQTRVDTCASNPCQNGASCVSLVNKYECECVGKFSGPQCQVPTDGCVYGGHYVFNERQSDSLVSLSSTGLAQKLFNTSFTVGAWVRRDDFGNYDFVLSQGTRAEPHQLLYFGFRANDAFSFGFFDDNLDTDNQYQEIGYWRYWTATYSVITNQQNLYTDNALLVGSRTARGPLPVLDGPLRIGRAIDAFGVDTHFHGALDEIRVFTTALDPAEIAYAYTHNGIFTSLSAAVLFIPFRHGSMIDMSGNGMDMTIASGNPYYQLADSPDSCNAFDPCMNATYPCVSPAICAVSVFNNSNYNCSCASFQFGEFCQFST